MEAWVMAALFPNNRVLARKGWKRWECHANPEGQLGQQPAAQRIKKRVEDYEAKSAEFRSTWPRVRSRLAEAKRFSEELLAAIESATE